MSKHDPDLGLLMVVDKVRARLPPDLRDKAGPVTDAVMQRYRRIARFVPRSFMAWARNGLYQWLIARFKGAGVTDDRQLILDKWTQPDERAHVEAFGDVAFLDPHDSKYKDLVPERTDDEIDRGGDYKITMGESSIRAGRALKALAALRRSKR
jgi:hypothetical protein